MYDQPKSKSLYLSKLRFFFVTGSTTDLTPTLIGIYDSFLEPKSVKPKPDPLEKAKDARNDPPVPGNNLNMKEKTNDNVANDIINKTNTDAKKPLDNSGTRVTNANLANTSALYSLNFKSDQNVGDKCDLPSDQNSASVQKVRTFKDIKNETAFGNLSPNVKRMISGATETTTVKFQKKTVTTGRSSMRHKSNIPLVGATSKISQSGVQILPSVEIYDQPCSLKSFSKTKSEENESPKKNAPIKSDFKIDEVRTYDVPTNNRPLIYDIPNTNKNAFESLSLPYIDQSIELSITSNDREFDIKLSSKDNSPVKMEVKSQIPAKIPNIVNGGTNSLHRKDFESPSKQLSKTEPYPEVIGSTGNLKSSEKEVIRLNPPVEVSRPLSMSSIASSSSTSSSGVQNKGVNSAYLASIESLDDHSDADLTSANGSNNFVNNAGISNTVSVERHSESPRELSYFITRLNNIAHFKLAAFVN